MDFVCGNRINLARPWVYIQIAWTLIMLFPTLAAQETRTVGKSPWDDYWFCPENFGTPEDLTAHASVPRAMSDTAVWQAIRVLSEGVAMLPLILYERVGEQDKRRAINHPLFPILHDQPNPHITSFEFIEMMMAGAAVRGNGFAQKEFDRNGDVESLWPLHSHRMESIERRGRKLFYMYRTEENGRSVLVAIPEEKILHIRGFSLGGLMGLHPVAATWESVWQSLALRKFFTKFFTNGANAGGVFEHPNIMKEDQHKRLKASIAENNSGLSNAHLTMILEDGMTWKHTGVDPEAAQALESRQFQVVEVARIFNVQPHRLMELTRATFSNIESQGIEFVVYTLGPWLRRWEQRITKDLLFGTDKRRFFAEFLRAALLQGTLKERNEAYQVALRNGWLNRNEVRGFENMNRIEGESGKVYTVELNMMNSEQLTEEPVDLETESSRSVEFRVEGQARLALRAAFAAKILAAASKLVRGEVREIRKNFIPQVEALNNDAATRWADKFYLADDAAYLALAERTLKPSIVAYANAIGKQAALESGLPLPSITKFIDDYFASLTKHQRRGGNAQLKSILNKSGPGGVIKDLETRMDQWLDRRAQKIARRQVIQVDGAIASQIWKRQGVKRLTWHALGDTCPFCLQLDGQTVGVESVFVEAGTAVEVEGQSPMWAGAGVLHPPLHEGCDCFLTTA